MYEAARSSNREILPSWRWTRWVCWEPVLPFLAEMAKLPTLAECDATVLVTGPTGTGKELVARDMHYLS